MGRRALPLEGDAPLGHAGPHRHLRLAEGHRPLGRLLDLRGQRLRRLRGTDPVALLLGQHRAREVELRHQLRGLPRVPDELEPLLPALLHRALLLQAGLPVVGPLRGVLRRPAGALDLALLRPEFLVQRVLLLEQGRQAAVHLEKGQVLLLQVEQLGKLRVHRCSCVEWRRAREGPPWRDAGGGAAASTRDRAGAPVPPGAGAAR